MRNWRGRSNSCIWSAETTILIGLAIHRKHCTRIRYPTLIKIGHSWVICVNRGGTVEAIFRRGGLRGASPSCRKSGERLTLRFLYKSRLRGGGTPGEAQMAESTVRNRKGSQSSSASPRLRVPPLDHISHSTYEDSHAADLGSRGGAEARRAKTRFAEGEPGGSSLNFVSSLLMASRGHGGREGGWSSVFVLNSGWPHPYPRCRTLHLHCRWRLQRFGPHEAYRQLLKARGERTRVLRPNWLVYILGSK